MEIVRTKRYLRDIRKMKASDQDIAALEAAIAANPTTGDLIPGLEGIRKIRFSLGGTGETWRGACGLFSFVISRYRGLAVCLFKN